MLDKIHFRCKYSKYFKNKKISHIILKITDFYEYT